jgi:hypothetical protein
MSKKIRCIILCTLLPATIFAQATRYVPMQPQPLSYTPTAFHITEITDDRGHNYIGTLKTTDKEQLELQGGTASWFRQFIEAGIKANNNTQSISLHVVKLDIDMKQKGGVWQVNSSIDLAFYVVGTKVMGYSAKSQGETGKSPEVYITDFIGNTLAADFKRFDEWWGQNSGKVPTNPNVKLNVTFATTTGKPNTIIYNTARPLKISDFTGPAENTIVEQAATYSGIMLGYVEHIEKGETIVDVTVTPYFDVSKSWFKPEGKTPAVLAHEQTHFDITAIKACELAAAIRNAKLTRDNYASVIEQLQKQSSQATGDEEELFDAETKHGIVTDKEAAWEKKVKQQVKAIGCY